MPASRYPHGLSLLQAMKLADDTYSGVYIVTNAGHGYWRVTLHSPTGPVYWITPDGRIGSRDALGVMTGRNGDYPDDACASFSEAIAHHDADSRATSVSCDSGRLVCGYVGIPHVAECWEHSNP